MKIAIIGGGYAGAACAIRLARLTRHVRPAVDITLINPSARFVERIRLHQAVAGQTLAQCSLAELLQAAGVHLRVATATRIDLQRQRVEQRGGFLAWDRLVLALGSQSGMIGIPGSEQHAWSLRTDEIAAGATKLALLPVKASVVVVGGGLTAIEAATEIRETYPGLRVTLLTRGRIASSLSPAARQHVLSCLDKLGVRCHEEVEVRSVRQGILLTSAGPVEFQECIGATGFEMPSLPRDCGLAVTGPGQILVDAQLRSLSHPRVYAAGDLAAPPPAASGLSLPMGCKSALPAGAQVAENLVREIREEQPQPFEFTLPYFCLSLGRRDGVIQWPDGQGRLLGPVLTGEPAARFKERVCETTWLRLVDEAKGRPVGGWPRLDRPPAHPAPLGLPS